MKLTFCGATKIVTGSCYLVETGEEKILVECGMFQGPKDITRLNYKPFHFNPNEISHVFLTHAHLDHSGLIPKLVAGGFNGEILATSATVDLCKVMLEDSAETQISNINHENKRRLREGLQPRKPLYTQKEVRDSLPLFKRVDYDKLYKITKSISVRYKDAGHILGSAIIEMFITEDSKTKKIVFSGDLGQQDTPIINDPSIIEDTDYLLIESTYGDRLHEDVKSREGLLLQYARETYEKGGKLLIPSFAVERTQELLYTLNKLFKSGEFPKEEVFLDSPLAIKVTEVFRKHRECFDEEALTYGDPFSSPNIVYTPKVQNSIRLNSYDKPCVIIAGSGMCTGGRIRHHFKHGLWDPKNTVLFVGYQAESTLGRVILEGAEEVRMMGLKVVIRAGIRSINAFSAHADYIGLIKWSKGFIKKPKMTFVVHGEPNAVESLKSKLEKEGLVCNIPSLHETVEI